jgi:ribonuclease P protein component
MQTECLEARVSVSLLPHSRIGVVVPKHGRTIVDRNRTKRRLRELVRLQLLPVIGRVDLLVRAKPEAYRSTFGELALEVDTIASWVAGITPH